VELVHVRKWSFVKSIPDVVGRVVERQMAGLVGRRELPALEVAEAQFPVNVAARPNWKAFFD
jgi:hypothetical protein